jgi:hypothetical protein
MRWSFRCFVEKMNPKLQGVHRITRLLFKWGFLLLGCYFLVFGYWEVKKGTDAETEWSRATGLSSNAISNAFQALHYKFGRSEPGLNRFSTDTNSIASIVTQWRLERSSFVPMPRYLFYWWWWDAVRTSETNTIYYRSPLGNHQMWVLTNSGTCYMIRRGSG